MASPAGPEMPSLWNDKLNNMRNQNLILVSLSLFLITGTLLEVKAQPEVAAWGNITGIRIDGQLMPFETSLCIVGNNWSEIRRTAKERQDPKYSRDGEKQIVSTRIDSVYFDEVVSDAGNGNAKVSIQLMSRADAGIAGIYFCVDLSVEDYPDAKIQITDPADILLTETQPDKINENLLINGNGIRILSPQRQLEVKFDKTSEIIVRKDPKQTNNNFQVYIAIHRGDISLSTTAQSSFTIKSLGEIDRSPATLTLVTSKTGRAFAGLGGNFRLQNPTTDPPVIDYCLKNLRVSWARVEMPWYFWHPDENIDPVTAAKEGKLNPMVRHAMEMAQRLYKMGIPVILSAWFPPKWAVEGEFRFRPQPGGLWGNPLNKEKTEKIYASITAYITYLKENYGAEIEMFSFNESDLGINVRQTGEEHDQLIKGLGAWFISKGLKTKMLLGDTADGNGYAFINEAMADPGSYPYIGAVSFHAWRGWATETLLKWENAASRLKIPLLVGEGSIDAAAWRYPAIFEEETYAREEINLYIRILAICQPLSILQWQLTADYSPLAGGGVFGNKKDPLHPTQRFWNLKQLSSTPEGLFAMPVVCDKPEITCAALGDNTKGVYAIHLVNNGTTREITLSGIPVMVKRMQMFISDKNRGMTEGEEITVTNGEAKFNLDAQSYTTLVSVK